MDLFTRSFFFDSVLILFMGLCVLMNIICVVWTWVDLSVYACLILFQDNECTSSITKTTNKRCNMFFSKTYD